jgi:hypothetical protein
LSAEALKWRKIIIGISGISAGCFVELSKA